MLGVGVWTGTGARGWSRPGRGQGGGWLGAALELLDVCQSERMGGFTHRGDEMRCFGGLRCRDLV